MVVTLTGNTQYSITLDPASWLTDDRKINLEQAFSTDIEENFHEKEAKKAAERWERAILQDPLDSTPVTHKEEEQLKNAYVMPIQHFLQNAQPNTDATSVILVTATEEITLPLTDFKAGVFLFAISGSLIHTDGPVQFIYKDGSNQNQPIKGIQKAIIQ